MGGAVAGGECNQRFAVCSTEPGGAGDQTPFAIQGQGENAGDITEIGMEVDPVFLRHGRTPLPADIRHGGTKFQLIPVETECRQYGCIGSRQGTDLNFSGAEDGSTSKSTPALDRSSLRRGLADAKIILLRFFESIVREKAKSFKRL